MEQHWDIRISASGDLQPLGRLPSNGAFGCWNMGRKMEYGAWGKMVPYGSRNNMRFSCLGILSPMFLPGGFQIVYQNGVIGYKIGGRLCRVV